MAYIYWHIFSRTERAPNISTIEITLKFRFGEDFLFPCILTFEVNSDNETIERPVCPNGNNDGYFLLVKNS